MAGCLAVVICGCGGGDEGASTSASATTQATTTANAPRPSNTQVEPQAGGKGKQARTSPAPAKGEGSKQQGNTSSHPKPAKPPAISSAPVAGTKAPAPGVKTVKGGDNSVQEYGVEAGEPQRTEASIALASYLGARAEEDWSAACSLLARQPTEQLERLAGGKADCAEVLRETAKGASSMPGSQIAEVLSFRGEGDISGDPSYLIFTGPPGQTLFSMPMYLQGGAWKVGLAQPSELPV